MYLLLFSWKNLEENIGLTKVKIERAEKLISGLGGEKVRWTENVERLSDTYDNIVGDVLLSAAVVAYLGPFEMAYRQVDPFNNLLKLYGYLMKPCFTLWIMGPNMN